MEKVLSRQFDAYLGNLYQIGGMFVVVNRIRGAYHLS
jgi:hypothetical protein